MILGAPLQVRQPRRRFMGQASNRLLPVRVLSILSRGAVQLTPDQEDKLRPPFTGFRPSTFLMNTLDKIGMTPEDIDALYEVNKDPTPEEAADLRFIDDFFGNSDIAQRRGMSVYDLAGLSILPYRFSPRPESQRAQFWDIDMGNPWGALKSENPDYLQNILVMEDRLANYPFPAPFEDYLFIWARHAIGGLRELVNQPGKITDSMARVWLTMSVLANYEAMVRDLEDHLREQEENARRRALTTALGSLSVGSLVAIGLAGSGIASSIVKAVTKGIASVAATFSRQDQARLAEDLAEAQEGFQSENPAFASEIGFTKRILDFLEKNAGDLSGMTPEDQNEAVDAALLGIPTWVWVAGGAAALGVGAYFLFR